MATTKNWTPSEKQVNFMAILEKAGKPISLKEIKAVYGQEFQTGSINALITKGKVHTEKVEVAYTQIKKFNFNGVIIEEETAKTCKLTKYSLVGFDYDADVDKSTDKEVDKSTDKEVDKSTDKEVDFNIDSVNLDF